MRPHRWLCYLLCLLLSSAATHSRNLSVILPAEDAHAVNARILMKYMQRHDPEITSVSFRVMPGASSLVAANWLYNSAPRDGWTIGVTFKKTALQGAIGGDGINFDPVRFTWLGSAADGRKDAVLLVSRRDHDPARPLIIGLDSPLSMEPMRFILHALGGAARAVTGYKNTSEIRMALERNEIDALINSMIGINTQAPQLLQAAGTKVLLQWGNGSRRHPRFAGVPTLMESIADENLKALLAVSELQYVLIRPFLAPPGIPPERAITMRRAFAYAVTDPDYVQEAAAAGIEASLINWRETEAIVQEMVKAPRLLLDQLRP